MSPSLTGFMWMRPGSGRCRALLVDHRVADLELGSAQPARWRPCARRGGRGVRAVAAKSSAVRSEQGGPAGEHEAGKPEAGDEAARRASESRKAPGRPTVGASGRIRRRRFGHGSRRPADPTAAARAVEAVEEAGFELASGSVGLALDATAGRRARANYRPARRRKVDRQARQASARRRTSSVEELPGGSRGGLRSPFTGRGASACPRTRGDRRHVAVQQHRRLGGQVVQQRRGLVEEQRQVARCRRGDAVGDVLPDRRARRSPRRSRGNAGGNAGCRPASSSGNSRAGSRRISGTGYSACAGCRRRRCGMLSTRRRRGRYGRAAGEPIGNRSISRRARCNSPGSPPG